MKTPTKLFFTVIALLCHVAVHAQVTLSRLDQLASELLTVSRIDLEGEIVVDAYRAKGFASINWQDRYATIYVDPIEMRMQSVNTWAFVIGHELAHQILRHRGGNGSQQEFDADVVGAKLAINAGYNVCNYISKLYVDPNICSLTHGCWHERARNLELRFCNAAGWPRKDSCRNRPGIGAFPPLKYYR